MKTAIATVSISGTLREKLSAIAAAGFDGIEIFEQDFIAHDGSPSEVGAMIRDHGLEIPLFQPFRDFEGLPAPLRAKAFDRAERKFDLMQQLSTDLVLVCSSCHPASLGGIDRAADDFVQLADAPQIEMDLLYWSRHFRNMPGEGDLPVTDFMRAVTATGYVGPISLEIFNDQFRGGSATTIAKDGYRSLVCLMDDVRRAEPESSVTLPPIPDRTKPVGVSLVEFATRGKDADEIKTILRSLGFQPSAHHLNKSVTLWQQDEIRFILNGETRGLAASAYRSHGTTICDIGLKVDNARATLDRATALGAPPFDRPVGPGELDIPAIRGLSGSVLHFLDASSGLGDVWNVEFRPDDAPRRAGTGLTRIDHLAQTMSILYDEDTTGGQFFQLYSRPFAGGMFIEIVQRSGGYAGYGAPNAPFRIAAQKRLIRAKGMPKS